jgi:hypothetical protein
MFQYCYLLRKLNIKQVACLTSVVAIVFISFARTDVNHATRRKISSTFLKNGKEEQLQGFD